MAVRIRDAGSAGVIMIRMTAVAVVVTLALFQTAYISNLHVHVLPDGRIVAHSHPVERDSKSGSGHQHLQYEYSYLNALGKLLQADITTFSAAALYLVWTQPKAETHDQCILLPGYTSSASRRGPPESASI